VIEYTVVTNKHTRDRASVLAHRLVSVSVFWIKPGSLYSLLGYMIYRISIMIEICHDRI